MLAEFFLTFFVFSILFIQLVTAQCGQTEFTELSGRITSPGFPGQYPSDSDCTYEIIPPTNDNQVQVNFLMMDIEFSGDCNYDWLEVVWVDAGAGNAGAGKQCGTDSTDLNGTGGLRLIFKSDGSENGNGFELEYNIISACNPSPCQHEGTCLEVDGAATCNCETAPGWQGDLCEVEINECESIPCQNDGLCHDELNGYICECLEGFEGDICEIVLDPCGSGPCFHGGECETLSPTMYSCHCLAGYHGANCELENDPCENNPCLNNGQCTKLTVLLYNCDCINEYEGENCEIAPFNPMSVFIPVVLVGGLGGGGYWYFMVLKPQQEETAKKLAESEKKTKSKKSDSDSEKSEKKSKKSRKSKYKSESSDEESTRKSRKSKSRSRKSRSRKRSTSSESESLSGTGTSGSSISREKRKRKKKKNKKDKKSGTRTKNRRELADSTYDTRTSRTRTSIMKKVEMQDPSSPSLSSLYEARKFGKHHRKSYNFTGSPMFDRQFSPVDVRRMTGLPSRRDTIRHANSDGYHDLDPSYEHDHHPAEIRKSRRQAMMDDIEHQRNLQNLDHSQSVDGEIQTEGAREYDRSSRFPRKSGEVPHDPRFTKYHQSDQVSSIRDSKYSNYISPATMQAMRPGYSNAIDEEPKVPMPNLRDLKNKPNAADLVNIYKMYRRYKQANDPRISSLNLNLPNLRRTTVSPMNSLDPKEFDKELTQRELDYLRRRVANSEGQLYTARQEASYWRQRNTKFAQEQKRNSKAVVPK